LQWVICSGSKTTTDGSFEMLQMTFSVVVKYDRISMKRETTLTENKVWHLQPDRRCLAQPPPSGMSPWVMMLLISTMNSWKLSQTHLIAMPPGILDLSQWIPPHSLLVVDPPHRWRHRSQMLCLHRSRSHSR
jgi:hypothetical protein